MKIDKALRSAYHYYQTGDLNQASSVYKKILRENPTNIDALHMLETICCRLGDFDSAIKYIKKEIELTPSNADAYYKLGTVFQAKGLFSEAIGYFRRAITLKPGSPDAYYNLGLALQNTGQVDEAILNYQKAVQSEPRMLEAYNNLGILLSGRGRLEEAIAYFQKALRINPNCADIYNNLGLSLTAIGKIDDALVNYQKAIMLNPAFADAYNNLGLIFLEKGKIDEAISCYQKALHLNPGFAETCINLGEAFSRKNESEKAIMYYKLAIQKKPDIAMAYYNIGTILQRHDKFEEAISYFQKAIEISPDYADAYNNLGVVLTDRGQLNEAETYFKRSLQIKPDKSIPYSNLLLNMNYNSHYGPQDIFSEHLQFAKQFAEPLCSAISPHTNERSPSRLLKIGYVSPDFRRHSVAYFIEPVLTEHNPEHIEVFCYSNSLIIDEVTRRIQARTAQWRTIVGMSDEDVAELVRKDNIDILIDLAGHTAGNRILLFAHRPAPIQVSWIGYPATTGLSVIDYKIVDGYTDPSEKTEQFYTEKLMRLPESFICYMPDKDSPAVGPLPALPTGHITFGSFNNIAKITPEIISLWAGILNKIPESCLILKGKGFSDETTCHYAINMFAKRGIDARRIKVQPWTQALKQHLELYNQVDIGLDTFPYNGVTTTCEALWMGVPVITLAGETHASRVGVSLLSNVGLPELIAETQDEYIGIAMNLASDIERLQLLRKSLRDRMARSPLTDAKQFTAHLEKCYRKMWETWCNP